MEDAGQNHSLDKAKSSSNSANNSMLNTWDSFAILWDFPRDSGCFFGSSLAAILPAF